MNQNPAKFLKLFIYLIALLNIMTFLIAFNFSNLEGIHHRENLITLETGITSQAWAYSFVISLMILLGSIFYNLKALSDNRRYHTILRSVILIIASILIYSLSFVIPFHENIVINKSQSNISIQRYFVLQGLSEHKVRFEDIDHIKYTLQYYAIRNPRVLNHISAISLVLANGNEVQVSVSTQDINNVSLREKLVQEISQATSKKIVTVQQ